MLRELMLVGGGDWKVSHSRWENPYGSYSRMLISINLGLVQLNIGFKRDQMVLSREIGM